jgi:chromate transporter
MHIGHERAGWKGLVTAGFCFILPAVIITAVVALAYQRYGQLPYLQPFIFGIKPAVIAVVVATMIALGRKALKSAALGILGLASGLAVLAGANEITVLFAAGFIGVFLCLIQPGRNNAYGIFPFTLLQINQAALDTSSLKLFLIFLKIGSILYGSGYVLFAFLNAELVAKGLLSKQQLIDAVAVGQFTPGPVFSSATFIGWQVGGLGGAVAATVGIFLPSCFFVALLNPIVPKLRKSKVMGAFLDSVNIASIAIILSVIIEVSREVLLDPRTILIAITSFIITFYFKKINIVFIITGGAILGYVLSFT